MVIISTNINKTNNYPSPSFTEHIMKRDHDIEKPFLGQAQTCGGVKPVNEYVAN